MLANAGAVFADMRAGDISLPRQALSNLRPPLAVVQGELSPKLYHRVVRWLMGRVPSASRSVLPGAGHAMMLDRPLELAQLVRDAARTEIQR
jgi:pimeloyl-ACP methyl ester carboxylesterase